MPYPTRSYKLSFLFQLFGTDEVASFDVKLGPATNILLPNLTNDDVHAAHDACQDLLTATAAYRAQYSRFVAVKGALLDFNGDYEGDPVIYPSEGANAGSYGFINPTSTVVCSLRSGSGLGKGNYGRFYLPYSGLPGLGEPRMNTDQQATFLGAYEAFVEELNGYFGALSPATVVRIMGQSGLTGTNKAVAEIGVGRVIDTQRRRRNRLEEAYTFLAV
jgi:hypothetical protein